MKRRTYILGAVMTLSATAAMATGHWTLQSKDYTVDTVFHAKIGPGTTQTSLSLTGGSNLKIFYTTTDLTDPYVDIRVAQAGSKLTGGAKLSAMSNANTKEGAEYFAGVNADFFGSSQPIGASVVNGEVYKAPGTADWVSFYMNDSKVPGIEKLNFSGTATAASGSHPVTGINMGRGTDNLIIYNIHNAANTGTNAYGSEVVVTCDRTIGYNGTYECTVAANPVAGVGSMTIPDGKYILSGHGTAATWVNSLKAGDKITLDLNTTLATGGEATQMAGGQPIILQNGVTLETQGAIDHLTALNPRTAIGFSADHKKLVMLVVDGRGKGGSVGVVSKVLADIMREVGCADAMNFDGGGSSELYTRSFGVRNNPSDGTERTVVNSVWAVSTAPSDDNVAAMAFTNPTITLPKYSYYTPTLYAYNQYDVIFSTDFKDAVLSCGPELGQIIDGKTLFATGEGTHKLTATYNGVTTELTVTIGTAAPRTRLEKVLLDGHREYKVEVVAEVEGKDMAVDNMAFEWSVDDATVVEVDQTGTIRGIANGKATVSAKVDSHTFSLPVTVEKSTTRYGDILTSDISGWSTTKSGLSAATISAAEKGLAIDYKISSSRAANFTLKPSDPVTLYSLPDSVRLIVNPGNATIKSFTLTVGPAEARGTSQSADVTLTPNTDNVISMHVERFCDTSDISVYPLAFSQIKFDLSGATGDEGRIEIPAIQAVYASVDNIDGIDEIKPDKTHPAEAVLNRNVVTRGTAVELNTPGTWTVYGLNGATVAAGQGLIIDTAVLPIGNYIVVTRTGSARLTVH